MKNILLLLFIAISSCVYTQVPNQINYQAVARNSVGNVLPNKKITARLSIREGSATGTILYNETRTLTTNNFGLFTIAIGSSGADNTTGTMSGIDWSTAAKFIQVELDPEGGSNFINMGAAQLLSVPYALHAGSAATGTLNGNAGGVLTGTYPNPSIANGAITQSMLAGGVMPTSLPPNGNAGGDLTGIYPNPTINNGAITTNKLADNSVTTSKIVNASVTGAKLAAGVIPTSLPPNGNAGGDLTGNYPNPTINNGVITTNKLADNSVTTSKVVDGSITMAKLGPDVILGSGGSPIGPAGGDLTGAYPNPTINNGVITTNKLANNSVTTSKIVDASVTNAKLAAGVIPTSLPPNGTAGGDLTGNYPNPIINNGAISTTKLADNSITTSKIVDASVTSAKLAAGVIPTSLPPNGTAGGDLTGSYPNPTINNAAITTAKIADDAITNSKVADNAITTSNVVDGSITMAKLGPDVIFGSGGSPSGPAGGDLSGTYPNPNLASGSVTTPKIANGSVVTPKLADGAVNTNKLADNSVTTAKVVNGSITLAKLGPDVILGSGGAPTGPAGGDLAGSYPNPLVSKIQNIGISNTAPINGQVLKFNGTQWAPATDDAGSVFTLPYSSSANNASSLMSLTNQGAGSGLEGINSSTNANVSGIIGKITSTTPGSMAAAVKGINSGSGTNGIGIYGTHLGNGSGVYGSSVGGTGVYGISNNSFGLSGNSVNGTGLFGQSTNGNAASFNISNVANTVDAVYVSNAGQGNAIYAESQSGNGITAITSSSSAAAIWGFNNNGGVGIWGVSFLGTGAGVKGTNTNNGGTALEGELQGVTTGNTAVFKVNGANVARINQDGKGFFNGGTQNSGADIAEAFDVTGDLKEYEAGDVLVISTEKDRAVERSGHPYSTLVAGVYATKPGVLLTEENIDDDLTNKVPMGVIGVIPTKVCLEGGIIKRGDLIVTSSIPGVAMKGDPDRVKIGQVIGKALQDYKETGIGKIKVLVSIK